MTFDEAFCLVIAVEQGFSKDPSDPGNWTGGKVGLGQLKGTKYGISAATFPQTDIANLTLSQAKALAKTKYWDAFSCDSIPGVLGYLVFDAAYNGGHPVQWLQQAVGVTADGNIGAVTIAAVNSASAAGVALSFMASRFDYWASMDAWPAQGRGWIHRGTTILRTVSNNI